MALKFQCLSVTASKSLASWRVTVATRCCRLLLFLLDRSTESFVTKFSTTCLLLQGLLVFVDFRLTNDNNHCRRSTQSLRKVVTVQQKEERNSNEHKNMNDSRKMIINIHFALGLLCVTAAAVLGTVSAAGESEFNLRPYVICIKYVYCMVYLILFVYSEVWREI